MVFLYLIHINLPNFFNAITKYEDFFVIDIALPLALTLFVFSILPRCTQWLAVLLSPWALMESFYITKYERTSDEHIYAIIKETNFSEAIAWLNFEGILLLAGSILLFVIGVFIRKPAYIFPKRWKIIFSISSVVLLISAFAPEIVDNFPDHANAEPKAIDSTHSINQELIGEFEKSSLNDYFPWGLPLRIQRYVALQQGMKNAKQALQDFYFDARQATSRLDEPEIHVLVIGETGRPDRWQLNGYARATNPLLSKQKDLISFTNVTTGWAWTRMSVPVIISRKPSRMESYFPEKSIISVFKEAGFWTAWYSTQGALGFHESAVALHASEASDVQYINPAGYRSPGAYDGQLLELLHKALNRPEKKKFIVLHTLGSHYNYVHRNPQDFDYFLPTLRGKLNTSLHDKNLKEELNNSYDNSIKYTDYFLHHVIENLKIQNMVATLLYVADHGENIFDENCDKSGHGHNTEYDYRIAATWWNSEKFGEKFPAKVFSAKSMKTQAWSTENIFESLADAADIKIKNNPRSNKSILSENFQTTPRWVQSGLFFDRAARSGACKVLTHTAPLL